MCWKRSAPPPPTPAPMYDHETGYASTMVPDIPCTKEGQKFCSNDTDPMYCNKHGICCINTLVSEDKNCLCEKGYEGDWCERKSVDQDYLNELAVKEAKRVMITTAVCVFVAIFILALAACTVLVIFRRNRKRRGGNRGSSRSVSRGSAAGENGRDPPGHEVIPLNIPTPPPPYEERQQRDHVDVMLANAHQVRDPPGNDQPANQRAVQSQPGLSGGQATSERGGADRFSTSQSRSIPPDIDKFDSNMNGGVISSTNDMSVANGNGRTVDNRDVIDGKRF